MVKAAVLLFVPMTLTRLLQGQWRVDFDSDQRDHGAIVNIKDCGGVSVAKPIHRLVPVYAVRTMQAKAKMARYNNNLLHVRLTPENSSFLVTDLPGTQSVNVYSRADPGQGLMAMLNVDSPHTVTISMQDKRELVLTKVEDAPQNPPSITAPQFVVSMLVVHLLDKTTDMAITWVGSCMETVIDHLK